MLEGAGRGGAGGHLTELNGWTSPQLLLIGAAMPVRVVKQSDALEDVHAAIG